MGEPGAVPEESSVEDAIRLMKFWTLDEIGAQSLASGRALEQQMELNEKERIIVQFPGSVFILGRSGATSATLINYESSSLYTLYPIPYFLYPSFAFSRLRLHPGSPSLAKPQQLS